MFEIIISNKCLIYFLFQKIFHIVYLNLMAANIGEQDCTCNNFMKTLQHYVVLNLK